ncbi:hypothetical protein Hanom_Chr10g00960341 [Helianthus anomalus]
MQFLVCGTGVDSVQDNLTCFDGPRLHCCIVSEHHVLQISAHSHSHQQRYVNLHPVVQSLHLAIFSQ